MAKVRSIQNVPTYGQLVGLNANLQGYWRFAGNANDDDATASHLTVTGGETFAHAQVSPGISGAWIGGTPERRNYDRTGVDSSLQINGDITISCILNMNRATAPATTDGLVIASVSTDTEASTTTFAGAGAGMRYLLGIVDQGYIAALLSNGAGAAQQIVFSNEARIVEGVPNLIVFRRAGTTVEAYVNGELRGTATATAATGNGTGTNFVVGRAMGTARNFSGGISALAVWSAALTAGNITSLWDMVTTEVGDSPFATRAALVGTVISQAGPRYLTQSISGNTTYTLTNPTLGKVTNLDITVTGTPTIDVTGATFIRKDTVTAGRMILKIECIDDLAPTYIATLCDTV